MPAFDSPGHLSTGAGTRLACVLVLADALCLGFYSFWTCAAMSAQDEIASRAGASPKPNRLIHEKSPYLLQHAYNPVDWYPWGEEAFSKARREHKPIFLSIGYSTCHWCHVMEKESFSNPKIAAILNRHFVSIKVDREERPDVDRIYMTAVQAMTGSGGWPLSVWLTPDLKPFFGGTYFPPDSRWDRPGFEEILRRVAGLWDKEPQKLAASGQQLVQALSQQASQTPGAGAPGPKDLDNAYQEYVRDYDPIHGGFGGAPKFPMPVNLNFLLGYYGRARQPKALEMARHTLEEMAQGGIYDQLGGGFHRYSTDDHWHVPHFEKMLYDNAQIAVNCLEAYQISHDESLARVARRTLDYVLRDMSDPRGGFYSAEDADSLEQRGSEERKEGAFYVWTQEEILNLVGKQAGEMFCYRYGVKPEGNAENDPQGEFQGKNILYQARSIAETAQEFGKPEGETARILEEARQNLFKARSLRPRPQRDDKILTSWNGLMISALSKGAQVLEDPRYLERAEGAAQFLQKNLYDPRAGRLYHRWRAGEKNVPGFADDYAFLVQGLLDLYESSFDARWLEWAIELTGQQQNLFFDSQNGGFYLTASDQDKDLLVRSREESDNVEPSAASVAALNLLRLAQFADREDFRSAAQKTLSFFGEQIKTNPRSLPQMLRALEYSLAKSQQVVIAGDPSAPDTQEMLRRVYQRFLPNKILVLADGGTGQKALARLLPFVKGVAPIRGKATAYVCIHYVCDLPTTDLAALDRILDGR